MITNIRAWGNSQGIYIPKKLLTDASMSMNDQVELSLVDGGILISKSPGKEVKAKALESLRSIRALHTEGNTLISDDYKKEIEAYLDEKYGK